MSQKYIVHEEPAVRTASQRIAMADLAPFGFPGLHEQVWLGGCEDGLFVMQCVPFRIYGLNLFDVVRLDEDGMLVEVVEKGGHRTLRALLEAGLEPQVFEEVAGGIASRARSGGFAVEWSGDRHAAIDVPAGGDSASLVAFMDAHEEAGTLFWEWSESQPFQGP
ncbi:DUF4265 domain-containing protein [Streptomyces nymphaeiformis]|uniref:DUF4265 domain-containing protein n=1 Tax=Streptomyces nymphaeiformis TaxID=2663842 RepID=A0A7W7XG58_9ACTN|nr:DUF4265 domain-containing protein [Streptomyces nymphaeiformis]MBB4987155.1 hypothetical protein [Streptomyces nymphaeiformis]